MRQQTDLTGLKLGTWTLIAPAVLQRGAPTRGTDGSILWRCKCATCGYEVHVSVGYVRTLQRRRKAPHCATIGCSAGQSTRRSRRRSNICSRCGSLPHRVTGKRCSGCRLAYEAEPLPPVEFYARGTSALAALMGGGDS